MDKNKKEFNRIILAVDDSQASERAASKALYLAKVTGIEITTIHVVHVTTVATPPPPAFIPDTTKSMEKNGKKLLDKIVKMGSDIGVKVKKELLKGLPYEEIIKFSGDDDIIIMGCKGHSAIGRILLGSTSEEVLHHSNSTVMIVR
jgi:nucleotide-binding universal stress UspA family protein